MHEQPAPSAPDRTRRWALLGVAAGVVIAALLVVGGALEVDEQVDGEEAAEQLVDAWRRHRLGTFVVESEWRRTKAGTDGGLASATLLVQRPPDRIQRQFGAVRGQLNGEQVRCSTDPVGGYRCFASDAPAPDYTAEVEAEAEALRSYALGPTPIYAVTADGDGCFTLDLIAAYPDPPYGRRAQLCFDDATGALRYLRRELVGVVEEQEALEIRQDVTDADFDLSEDPDYEVAGDLPEPDLEDLVGGSGTTSPPTTR